MSADVDRNGGSGRDGTHRVLASCSLSKVFCLFSSSIRVTVTSFSLGFDSAVVMGRVTPMYLEEIQRRVDVSLSWKPLRFVVWQSHFVVCREVSGSELQVFVEAQTQPTHGVCRQATIPKADSSQSSTRALTVASVPLAPLRSQGNEFLPLPCRDPPRYRHQPPT